MKTWIKTNLSKITLALALTGAISGKWPSNIYNNVKVILDKNIFCKS